MEVNMSTNEQKCATEWTIRQLYKRKSLWFKIAKLTPERFYITKSKNWRQNKLYPKIIM